MIYFDNNATTLMPDTVKKSLLYWCNRGNPSAGYKSAIESRAMIAQFTNYIGKMLGVEMTVGGSAKKANDSRYNLTFTSGASESNCTIIEQIINSHFEATGLIPHVIISAIEHKSIIDMIKSFESRKRITASYVAPTMSGHILAESIAPLITERTCLISVMHVNNETGAINDIDAIGAIAHNKNVPFHTDAVQSFGKLEIKMRNIDAVSISFHKLYGPPGIGALIVKEKLALGYRLAPIIFGTQNNGARGGTENLIGIGASFTALQWVEESKTKNIKAMSEIKALIISELSRLLPCVSYKTYLNQGGSTRTSQVVLISVGASYLFNTLFLSIVKRSGAPICNVKIKNALESQGVIISVGSACNTASEKASHVLGAMNVDPFIKKGALRISLSGHSTIEEAKKFALIFSGIVRAEMDK